jgi:hypothetical protein
MAGSTIPAACHLNNNINTCACTEHMLLRACLGKQAIEGYPTVSTTLLRDTM